MVAHIGGPELANHSYAMADGRLTNSSTGSGTESAMPIAMACRLWYDIGIESGEPVEMVGDQPGAATGFLLRGQRTSATCGGSSCVGRRPDASVVRAHPPCVEAVKPNRRL